MTPTYTRIGANIVQSVDGTLNDSGPDAITAAPLLAPLGNYGGPTQTMALQPGSPARNTATVLAPAITSDQRGFPIVGIPDIGAYEAGTLTATTRGSTRRSPPAPRKTPRSTPAPPTTTATA